MNKLLIVPVGHLHYWVRRMMVRQSGVYIVVSDTRVRLTKLFWRNREMKRITYTKHFLSGQLDGLTATYSVDADDSLADQMLMKFKHTTKETPAFDVRTRACHFISDVTAVSI